MCLYDIFVWGFILFELIILGKDVMKGGGIILLWFLIMICMGCGILLKCLLLL